MDSGDATWGGVYGSSGIALCLAADTRLTANQAARMTAIHSNATTNSVTTPSEDNEVIFCLRQAMTMGASA